MRPPSHIATDRLRLRPAALSDAPAIFGSYAQDPEVTRFLAWRTHTCLQDTEAFLNRCEAVWAAEKSFPWVVCGRAGGELLGMIELGLNLHGGLLGYVLARPHWGKGYMTEAAAAVVNSVMTQPDLHRVWAFCDLENRASARVCEKIGMSCEGTLRKWSVHPNLGERPRDCYCYAIVK